MDESASRVTICAAPGLDVHVRAPFSRVNLRGLSMDQKFIQAVASVAGVAPPLEPNTAACGLLATLLWLGPDEWMLTSETQRSADLVARLRTALKGVPAAVTDVTDARIVVCIAGERARAVLAKGCPVDLHPRSFTRGQCAQTLLAKASVLLHQRGPEPTFDLYVARSFADYVAAWLEQASREFVQA